MTAPALTRPLDHPSVLLLQRAAERRLTVAVHSPQIEALYELGLLTPDGLWWALASGVRLCEVCGQPGDSRECTACVRADDVRFKRAVDL